jgi:recombination protein RecT
MTTEIQKYEFHPSRPIGTGENMKAMLQSDRFRSPLMRILPIFSDESDPEKHIARLAMQAGLAFMQNPALKDCTQQSFFESMMHVAETGLSLSRQSGEAYLVPFKDNKLRVTNCTFMPGYRGLIKLACQTGALQSVDGIAVYGEEPFEYYETENGPFLRHTPDLDTDRKDNDIKYVYARAFLVGGGPAKVSVMNRNQVERIRAGSKAHDGPAWTYHWGEMAIKTTIKRVLKRIPQSTTDKAAKILEHAIDLDNQAGGFINGEAIAEELAAIAEKKKSDWTERAEAPPQPKPQETSDKPLNPDTKPGDFPF